MNGSEIADSGIEVIKGNTIDLLATTKSQQITDGSSVEYTFLGWYVNGKLLSKDTNYTETPTEDTMYIAKFEPESTLIYYQDGTIKKDDNKTLSGYNKKADIVKVECGSQCTSIAKDAFGGCTGIEKINLNNVTQIYDQAFTGCSSLKNVEAPKLKITQGMYRNV